MSGRKFVESLVLVPVEQRGEDFEQVEARPVFAARHAVELRRKPAFQIRKQFRVRHRRPRLSARVSTDRTKFMRACKARDSLRPGQALQPEFPNTGQQRLRDASGVGVLETPHFQIDLAQPTLALRDSLPFLANSHSMRSRVSMCGRIHAPALRGRSALPGE